MFFGIELDCISRFIGVGALAFVVLGSSGCKSCKTDGGGVPVAAADGGSSSDAALGVLPPAIPNAAASVDRIRPALRACFADQILRKPTPTGTVTFSIEVGPDGHVLKATPTAHDGLDVACIACMTEGVKAGAFEKPLDGLPATVVAPFTFHGVAGKTLVAPSASSAPPPH
jgi:hypothetical protein